jgi:hypothetical protein
MAISASDIRGLFFGRMEAGKLGIRSVELGIIKTQKGNRICYGWISLLHLWTFDLVLFSVEFRLSRSLGDCPQEIAACAAMTVFYKKIRINPPNHHVK